MDTVSDHIVERFLIPRDPAYAMFGFQRSGGGFESYQEDSGRTDITLRRAGNRLHVVDHVQGGVALDPVLSRLKAIRLDGRCAVLVLTTVSAATMLTIAHYFFSAATSFFLGFSAGVASEPGATSK